MSVAGAGDEQATVKLRGFGPVGLLAILVILAGNAIVMPGSAILVLAWARWSRTPWREIGYVRPRSWMGSLVVGLVLGAGFKLLMKAVVMPLLGADPVNHAYHFLAGNREALPWALYAMIVGAGFGEETVFRGYLFERLGKLLGPGPLARMLTVLVVSLWFGLDHYSVQGFWGAEQATIFGLVFGAVYAVTGRLFPLMVAHAAFDLTALAIIYWDLEPTVAHLIFK